MSAANSLVLDIVPRRQGPGIDAGFRRPKFPWKIVPPLAVSCSISLSLSLSPFAVAPSRHLLLCFCQPKTKRIPAWNSLGPWYNVSYIKLYIWFSVCLCFFPCLKYWVRLFGRGWFLFFVVDVCGRFVSVVLVELLWRAMHEEEKEE
jgi:hypothetical protein